MKTGAIAAALLLALGRSDPQAATNQDWPVYGGQAAGDHYSPLTQIDRQNAKNLKQAWSFDTGEHGVMQTSPIMVGRTLYAATPSEKIIALDAATGTLKWKFDSGINGTQPIRGVTYWNGKILAGIMSFLYELDAETGKPVESFGEHGRIDLRKDLGTNPARASVLMTTPGIVYKSLIIVGFRAPETHPAPRGDIRAYDLVTGKLRWSFHTIPQPGEFGYETWPKDAWKTAGAANNWAGMALDQERGIVYAPTGSAVDDFYGADRVGDDLFANTLLALNAETGERIWHFQGVHHDIWDRDFPSPPALVTVTHDGKRIEAIAQTTKQGYLFLFDRVTGRPVFPIEEVRVEQTTVPGEVSSPTQPRPTLPEPFARQTMTEQTLSNRTPAVHAQALAEFRTFHVGAQFTPLSVGKQTLVMPGFDGGAEWGGPALDPRTGVIYVNAQDMAYTGGLSENTHTHSLGASLYLSQCAVCHGEQRLGSPPEFPSLLGVGTKLNAEQITTLIHGGKNRMPSYPNIQGEGLSALIEYLRTGKDEGPAAPQGSFRRGVPVPGSAAAIARNPRGAEVYSRNCAICHGDQAGGIQPGFPSLIGVGQRLSPEQVATITTEGKGRMPGFHKLSTSDMSELMRYLGAVAVNPDEEKTELAANGQVESRYRFTGYRRFVDADGYPAVAPPWGTLNAIDLNTGKFLWKIPFGEYPELAARGVPTTGSENYGGPVVTAGGVLFIGATIFDRQFHVFDSSTGKLLWHTELPYGGLATPATYMVDGKQYVVIGAGGGKDSKHPLGGVYTCFALP